MTDATEDNIPNLLFNEMESGELTKTQVIGFVIIGIIMTIFGAVGAVIVQ